MTRRVFLKNGALALIGTTAIPSFLARVVLAAGVPARGKRLVVIFQRGAADGLNIVVPHGDRWYYSMRPSIAIARPGGAESALDLDGFFGLHPAMASLKPLWDARHLAVVHAAGSPDNTRSHFDAQDYMESGTPGVKSTADGWMNRAVRNAAAQGKPSPLRAVALGGTLPRILSGAAPAIAIASVNDFGVAPRNRAAAPVANTFEALYDESADAVLHGTGHETFEAVRRLRAADPARYAPAPGANYPRGPFGGALRQLAQLMKADLGVQVAFADIGGWDHHVNEGGAQGQLANRLREFSQALSAFWTDLGALGEDTLIVTMSEFGRTARENGNRGTDHGHANAMLVLGGAVRGGKVYGRWPGLSPQQLYQGRDLALTTDFRTVLAEALSRHLEVNSTASIFPGFAAPPYLNYLA